MSHANDYQTTGLFDGVIIPGQAFALRFFHTRFEIPLFRYIAWDSESRVQAIEAMFGTYPGLNDKFSAQGICVGEHGLLMRTETAFPLPAFGTITQVIAGVHDVDTLLERAGYRGPRADAVQFLVHGWVRCAGCKAIYHSLYKDEHAKCGAG
jgi:hypothetical protein